jgi:5-methyltetrahydrofolate--homocysteine methyltransferase
MSALLTTTMPKMEQTEAGMREQVKIVTGGAPVTQDFVDKIGADAYGANAESASEKAKALVTRRKHDNLSSPLQIVKLPMCDLF